MTTHLTETITDMLESAPASLFAEAMSTLASGVVLITCWIGDRPWGMTVTAFASVSADPPTVLISLASAATSMRAITATSGFGVSILAADQLAIAAYGSAPGAPKFLEPMRPPTTGTAKARSSPRHSPTSTATSQRPSTWPTTPSSSAASEPFRGSARDCRSSTTTAATERSPKPLENLNRQPKEPHMPLELTANTPAGEHLIHLADTLATEIGPQAAAHDRDGSFAFESLATISQSGFLAAPIPKQLGGLGVTSVHDVVVASSRLARGDAALSLGINMHLVYVLNVVRRWQIATAADDQRRSGSVRQDTQGDHPRRHRLCRRSQRDRAGHHPAGNNSDRHQRRLAGLRPQSVLHHVTRRRRALHSRHLPRSGRPASGTATP